MKKTDKASYLLDEMSNIDDSLLYEAEHYKGRGIRFAVKTALSAAAVIALCVFSVVWYGNILRPFDKNNSGEAPHLSFDEMLLSHKENASELRCDTVKFGQDMLVWQYEGDDGYYVLELKSEAKQIADLIGTGEKLSPEESEKQSVKLWFCSSNGEVYSPELLKSKGNVGYRCLFDYSSEIAPTEEMISKIDTLLSEF